MRTLFLAAALMAAPAALACGGQDCGANGACKMASTAEKDDVAHADGDKVELTVTGMKCGRCSDKVTAALKAIEGVNAVAVDHASGKAEIAFDKSKTNAEAFIAAVSGLHFEAKVVEPAKEG